MHTKTTLIKQIIKLGIKPNDTLLIHSSMKALGDVQGGAETVLDAFMEYLSQGLLIFPTHTWAQMNDDYCIFDPLIEPSCVGILPNLFIKRENVFRSWLGIAIKGKIGEATSILCDSEKMIDLTTKFLDINPNLFDDNKSIPLDWYFNSWVL